VLALSFIREHPDQVKAGLARKNETAPIDEILALDARRRQILSDLERLRAEQNRASRELAAVKGPKPADVLERLRQMRAEIRALEGQIGPVEEELNQLLLTVPNLPEPDVPLGADERDNVLVRTWGEPRQFDFTPRPHWELGERLGIIDFERGARVAGSRFYLLRGAGARLQRGLIRFMLDLHVREHGYTEIYAPFLVKQEVMWGSGQLPKFRDNLYHDAEDDLWLVPTAEVILVNLHAGEILEPGALPLNYLAYTACFRREKMSAGRDVRGIKRGHQFDKVELVKIVPPEESGAALEQLVGEATRVLERLDLPYQVVERCTGDLGFNAQKGYDINVWAPGVNEWLEVSSCSNCGEFQMRRNNTRFRRTPGGRIEYPHALNGSGLALPRLVIALLENYQQPDGSVRLPEALVPYVGDEVLR
jgi:seryl-tRNA synthetase